MFDLSRKDICQVVGAGRRKNNPDTSCFCVCRGEKWERAKFEFGKVKAPVVCDMECGNLSWPVWSYL
jgi:hypothetical protein